MRRRAFVAGLSLAGCADVWRRMPPETTPRPEVARTEWSRLELPAGGQLLQSAAPGSATVHLGLSLRGAGEDPPGQAGLTALGLVALVDRGLRDALARVGATPRIGWASDGGTLQVAVAAEHAGAAAEVLARRVRAPDLDALGFAAALGRAQAEAARAAVDPRKIAARALDAVVFPAGHPYVERGAATATSLAGVTADALAAHVRRTVVPARAMWLAVGEGRGVGAALSTSWEGWGAESGAERAAAKVTAERRGPIALVDRPGIDQAVIAVGRVGFAAADPDALYAERVARLLRSAVHERLRGDRGLAYFTDAGHDEGRLAGRLRLITQVDAAATGEALEVVLWSLEHVQELEVAQRWMDEQDLYDGLEDVYRQDAPDDRVLAMARRHRLGLPLVERAPARRPVTRLAAVGDALLRPSTWQIVCVGDRRRVQAQLERFGAVRLLG